MYFLDFCSRGGTKTGTRRTRAMIWRAQIEPYLVGRMRLSPLMKVVMKVTTNRPSLLLFSVLNSIIAFNSGRIKSFWKTKP